MKEDKKMLNLYAQTKFNQPYIKLNTKQKKEILSIYKTDLIIESESQKDGE